MQNSKVSLKRFNREDDFIKALPETAIKLKTLFGSSAGVPEIFRVC